MVSPLQADGKHCVHDVLFLILLVNAEFQSTSQLTHVKSM